MTIPKLIHQIYLSANLPPRLVEHVSALKARNPGWTHRLYANGAAELFIDKHYDARIFNAYRSIDPSYGAARADLLRHLIIYKLGGVYLDIKSDMAKPLDEVLRPDDEYLLAQWDNAPGQPHEGFGLHPELAQVPGGEYQTHHIIAAPNHPFSKAAIDRIVGNIENYGPLSGVGKMGVVRTTGPSAYTLAVHPLLGTAPYRKVTEAEIGSSLSISDYDHQATFPTHYSTLQKPVVRLNRASRLMQRGVEALRGIKRAAHA